MTAAPGTGERKGTVMSDEHDDDKGARFDRRMRYVWAAIIAAMIAITTLELLGVRPKG